MKYQASGDAMINAITTSFKKSFDSRVAIFGTEAPNTFLMPISFRRASAIYVARPNKPRQDMKMANTAKRLANVAVRFSSANFNAYSSSTNLYSKGYTGLYFLKIFPIASRFFSVDWLVLNRT